MSKTSENKKSLVLQAVSFAMRPMVRLMLVYGLSYRDFSDMMKHVFYVSGQEMLTEKGVTPSASKLSLLTGIHRKDIADFLAEKKVSQSADKSHSQSAAIVAEWISNPLYIKGGAPKALPYKGSSESVPSFTSLVESVSMDVRPKSFLDEMLRLDIVRVGNDRQRLVTLKKEAFLPTKDFKQKIGFFKRNISDHIAAAASNIQNNPVPFFERSAFHEGLSEEDIQMLQRILHEDGMDLLKKVYRQAEEKNHKRKDGIKKKFRINCGLYFYAEEEGERIK